MPCQHNGKYHKYRHANMGNRSFSSNMKILNENTSGKENITWMRTLSKVLKKNPWVNYEWNLLGPITKIVK
jgi:hypothetical protein